jgi:hypothetical protein
MISNAEHASLVVQYGLDKATHIEPAEDERANRVVAELCQQALAIARRARDMIT